MAQEPARTPPEGLEEADDGWLLLLAAGFASAVFYFIWWVWPGSVFDVSLHQRPLSPADVLGTSYRSMLDYVRNLIVPYGLFLLALYGASALPTRRSVAIALAGAIGLPLVLVFAYPSLAADVFDYMMQTRIWVTHGDNPFAQVPSEFRTDPYLKPVGWPNMPTPYGPLFIWVLALPMRLAGDHMVAALVTVKLLAVAAHGATAWLVYLIVRRIAPQRALFALVAYGWNPMAVVFFGVDGHNDAFMLLFLAAALHASLRERHDVALLLLAASTLTKFVPLILLPFFLLEGRHQPRQLALGIGASLALAIVAFWPFWAGIDTLDGTREQGRLFTSSPATLLQFVMPEMGARAVMIVCFLAGYVAVFVYAKGLIERCFGTLTVYLVTASFWLKGWYITWPLMLASMLGGWPLVATTVWSVGPLAFYLAGAWGTARDWFGWREHGREAIEVMFFAFLFVPLTLGLLLATVLKRAAPRLGRRPAEAQP